MRCVPRRSADLPGRGRGPRQRVFPPSVPAGVEVPDGQRRRDAAEGRLPAHEFSAAGGKDCAALADVVDAGDLLHERRCLEGAGRFFQLLRGVDRQGIFVHVTVAPEAGLILL